MREYATTLEERERQSRIHRRKYWTDPDFRLRTVNRWRVWKGLEPYQCPSEIKSREEVGRASAAKQRRDKHGRYVA